jgi:hypothetical protein
MALPGNREGRSLYPRQVLPDAPRLTVAQFANFCFLLLLTGPREAVSLPSAGPAHSFTVSKPMRYVTL